jgi:hypothetical protein
MQLVPLHRAAAAMQPLDARDAAGRTPLEIALCHRPQQPRGGHGGNGDGGNIGGGGGGNSGGGGGNGGNNGSGGGGGVGGGGGGVYRVAVALLDAGASPDVAFSTVGPSHKSNTVERPTA